MGKSEGLEVTRALDIVLPPDAVAWSQKDGRKGKDRQILKDQMFSTWREEVEMEERTFVI